MRWLGSLAIIVLLGLLIGALYLLWINLPTEQIEYEAFKAEASKDLPPTSTQFEANMRYADMEITFYLSNACSEKKKKDFRETVQILEEKTILKFTEISSIEADITVTCSNISPTPKQEDHFVAGEGGPSLFINGTRYAVILEGEIALYRPEACDTPQVALHELLHALGFDHNSNEDSIMFPVTNCDQTIDSEITAEINRLYSEPSLADLAIEKIEANRSGRYLNFEFTVSNTGLQKVESAALRLASEGEEIKTFDIGAIDIGAKRHLTVSNLRLPRSTEQITFTITTSQPEITTDNNKASISTPG